MGYIRIKTDIPGPNGKRLLKEKEKAVSRGIDMHVPVFVKKANGALLEDVDGNILLDFAGGVGACNAGHTNKEVSKAIKRQADKFFHTCFTLVGYENFIKLCSLLNKITGGNRKSALFNSGAEAIENAIKAAKKYTGKTGIVSFEHGFHGRTLLTMSMTSKVKPYKDGFGPFAPEVYRIEYPYVYRRPKGMTGEDYVNYLLEHIEGDFFKGVVDPNNIACVVMELVTGEGGFIVAPKKYVKGLYKICKRENIVLIIDEVQTGFGRTGKLFAYQHYGIDPDIITVAKSMSDGLPLSGVVGKTKIMDAVHEGGYGGTFSGNPISCEAALAAVNYILKHKLADRAKHIGKIVMDRFDKLKNDLDIVGDARGLGAMCGLEIVKDKESKTPDEAKTKKIIEYCYKNGLILLETGILGNTIRTLMPLVIKDNQLKEGLDVIESAVKSVK